MYAAPPYYLRATAHFVLLLRLCSPVLPRAPSMLAPGGFGSLL